MENWHRFTFVIRDTQGGEDCEEISLDLRLPSREAAVRWAADYSVQHARVHLRVAWIWDNGCDDGLYGAPVGGYLGEDGFLGCSASDVPWDFEE